MARDFPTRDAAGEAVLNGPIYHYTSVAALKSIVDTGVFRATHAFYMSDATEITYGLSRMGKLAGRAAEVFPDEADREIVRQFQQWLKDLLVSPPQIFVMCFSEKRDDLNQWRSYAPREGGVCIGFQPALLGERARAQGWDWSNCKYQKEDQANWVIGLVKRVHERARERGPQPPQKAHPSQSYHPIFQELVEEVLQVACRLKDRKFEDEHEWRWISPYMATFADERIGYQPRGPLLVPYAEFRLGDVKEGGLITEVIIGPTAHPALSFNSIATYLSPRVKPSRVSRSDVPYRVF